jgi:hypothetical protein
MPRRRVGEVLASHNRYIDNLVAGFERELRGILASAQAHVAGELQKRLAITDGVIDRTPGNQRILRGVDKLMAKALDRAGYPQASEAFVQTFNGHLPYFEEMLAAISENLKTPLVVKWGKRDLALFETQQLSVIDSLGAIAEGAAVAAKKRALLSVGALPFGDLVEQVAIAVNRSLSEAQTLAETASTMFARTITDRGFRQIEADLPKGAIRYGFEGPTDKLTRDFCRRLVARTRRNPMTRGVIEKLDNGQLPDVFITGGGYNCRHQWIIEEIKQ